MTRASQAASSGRLIWAGGWWMGWWRIRLCVRMPRTVGVRSGGYMCGCVHACVRDGEAVAGTHTMGGCTSGRAVRRVRSDQKAGRNTNGNVWACGGGWRTEEWCLRVWKYTRPCARWRGGSGKHDGLVGWWAGFWRAEVDQKPGRNGGGSGQHDGLAGWWAGFGRAEVDQKPGRNGGGSGTHDGLAGWWAGFG